MSKNGKSIPDPNELEILAQEDFNIIIDKHLMYIRGQRGGARAILTYKNLSYLNFHNSNLSQADFTGSLLIGADMSFGIYKSACFFACDLRGADMSRADFSRADLRGCYLAGADLTGTDLTQADMREGKIMTNSKGGALENRKRLGSSSSKTIFTGAKMADCDMSGILAKSADFSDADLHGAILKGAQVSGAVFHGANLRNSDFSDADISHADMSDSIRTGIITFGADTMGVRTQNSISDRETGSKLSDTNDSLDELLKEHTSWIASAGRKGKRLDLSGYDLRDIVNLSHHPLTAIKAKNANFVGQDMRRANLQSAILDGSDFRDCVLEHADLRGASLKNTKMTRVNLRGANLSPLYFMRSGKSRMKRTDISGSSLRYADLRHANLKDAVLMGVDLTSAVLSGCDLRNADLTGAILKEVILDGALLDGAKIDFSSII